MLESGFLERNSYNDSLESASNFNTRLLVERQSRLPFFDTQTNVAQVRVVPSVGLDLSFRGLSGACAVSF